MWAWKHPHHDGTLTYEELRGYIELKNVDFGYEPGKEVLHDVSLYAKPGQKIAFVGATGAGKTTITKMKGLNCWKICVVVVKNEETIKISRKL